MQSPIFKFRIINISIISFAIYLKSQIYTKESQSILDQFLLMYNILFLNCLC
jgi:hypothetical protein